MDAVAEWSDFNVAMVGATAALAGLVIVAASVNIDKIIPSRALTARLAAAIAGLVLALVASGTGLIPDIDPTWYGVVIIVATVAAGAFQAHATVLIMSDSDPAARARVPKAVLGLLPLAAYLVAGIALAVGHDSGLLLTAVGCIVAIVSAILMSWIALVEVLR